MRRLATEIYRGIRKGGLDAHIPATTSVQEKLRALEEVLATYNMTKCTLSDLDQQEEGASTHLLYLLQKESRIDFGLCPLFKQWYNRQGEQQRCGLDKGKGVTVPVHCSANLKRCSHPTEYVNFQTEATTYEGQHLPIFPC